MITNVGNNIPTGDIVVKSIDYWSIKVTELLWTRAGLSVVGIKEKLVMKVENYGHS